MNELMTAHRSLITKRFFKTLIEVYSPHLYASLGTFCAHIGQSLEAQWILEVRMKIDKSLWSIFPKSFAGHERWAVENSFITYVCYAPDVLLWIVWIVSVYKLNLNNFPKNLHTALWSRSEWDRIVQKVQNAIL